MPFGLNFSLPAVFGGIGRIARGAKNVWAMAQEKGLSPVDNRGGWWPLIREGFTGAWQTNTVMNAPDVMRYWAVFRAISIISGDIAKMRLKLVEQNKTTGLWIETSSPAFSPLLRKPNGYQSRIQFFQNWMESKLSRGNTYVLKHLDDRGVVNRLTILNPDLVTPLVDDSGGVYYRLAKDNLSGLLGVADVVVPADWIIHDRWNTLYHPLVGLSPIYAIATNAAAGLKITDSTYKLFANGAKPSGIIVAPAAISDADAQRIKDYWGANFTGEKAGNVAVLGDGLEYKELVMKAVDAQLIQQLEWDDKTIFGAYGIPGFMANAGTAPAYNNVDALLTAYYAQALQIHIESIENLLDEGLYLPDVKGHVYGVEFALEDLLRMDEASKIKATIEGLKGLFTPDEARARHDLPPIPGGAGKTLYMQQQNYSIEALAKRDAKDDPFASAKPPANDDDPPEEDEGENDDGDAEANARAVADLFSKEFA